MMHLFLSYSKDNTQLSRNMLIGLSVWAQVCNWDTQLPNQKGKIVQKECQKTIYLYLRTATRISIYKTIDWTVKISISQATPSFMKLTNHLNQDRFQLTTQLTGRSFPKHAHRCLKCQKQQSCYYKRKIYNSLNQKWKWANSKRS